jgi:hypothetical protein
MPRLIAPQGDERAANTIGHRVAENTRHLSRDPSSGGKSKIEKATSGEAPKDLVQPTDGRALSQVQGRKPVTEHRLVLLIHRSDEDVRGHNRGKNVRLLVVGDDDPTSVSFDHPNRLPGVKPLSRDLRKDGRRFILEMNNPSRCVWHPVCNRTRG